jgi:hypothetical protein
MTPDSTASCGKTSKGHKGPRRPQARPVVEVEVMGQHLPQPRVPAASERQCTPEEKRIAP